MKNEDLKMYWDFEKNVPLILEENSDFLEVAKDLRPVFLQEKWLLINLFPQKLDNNFLEKSVWATKQNRYIVDGKMIDVIPTSKFKSMKQDELENVRKNILEFSITEEHIKKEKEIFEAFIIANKNRFNYLVKSEAKDDEEQFIGAIPFIVETFKKYEDRITLVSFSGGKDSTVVSHLVRLALNNPSILHIFGDTTLELPKSYEYVKRFQEDNPFTPFFEERNEENNFFEMCEEIGPPSRVKTWCCSIFKTGPMGTTLANFDENILTFLGLRRGESASRSKYKKVSQSPKILKQMVASPIIDWTDLDVWLYILSENLDFNDSYRQGFARVGCWVCPNNGTWSELLSSIYNSEEYDKWYGFLVDFSKKIGKVDYEDYVKDGKWKARQGGEGLEKSTDILVESKECVNEKNSKTFILNKSVNEDFVQLFKPFGTLKIMGKNRISELIILDRKSNPLFKIMYKDDDNEVKVTIMKSEDKYIFNKIQKQFNKFNSCLYCQGCNSACPTGAIYVSNGKYIIDEKKCVNCLKCIDKFDSGCLIASALKIKKR
ncbi:phosphoadenosine phosphosulfate reductase domain-containing protein [Candidatus Cetobacterium colombiensis]|uniref:Phosphoadenosine phosphosulfate reductase family protein n=1 Tax=Candidatus Cetobacterium colombiensis TaxID=3073100 RepID=A0ABU4W6Q2_9FUSO|nr:phosphoadenosine phosphosulfate reductase family protein [Candidatus Cetobacterium colombiensis]MDX8335216.1 phosphoadenosine phosphosulfate reductase family protein [Candidatus Cetobacterium colombiensis]